MDCTSITGVLPYKPMAWSDLGLVCILGFQNILNFNHKKKISVKVLWIRWNRILWSDYVTIVGAVATLTLIPTITQILLSLQCLPYVCHRFHQHVCSTRSFGSTHPFTITRVLTSCTCHLLPPLHTIHIHLLSSLIDLHVRLPDSHLLVCSSSSCFTLLWTKVSPTRLCAASFPAREKRSVSVTVCNLKSNYSLTWLSAFIIIRKLLIKFLLNTNSVSFPIYLWQCIRSHNLRGYRIRHDTSPWFIIGIRCTILL